MKHSERFELKKIAIVKIETMRLRIKNHFYFDTKVQLKIVDGKLSQIIEYKNFSKRLEAGKCKEMWKGASVDNSLNELNRQMGVIEGIIEKFGL